ncbi:hypothetical protein [Amycolatopsis sp. RTGN1]|uniref:hypothetical protein n=1 Tax=Amycolatopsis ponsaeliensis TaxID=2992142 RepID=UPI00254E840A|nr:hypothetical protein [Amycolatopsis sp. RTGN1]
MDTVTCQLPAIHASDDKIATTDNAVIMLDGASAFVPVPVAPAVYADELATRLTRELVRTPGDDLVELLAAAIHDVAGRLDLRPGRSPSSTVTILRAHDGWLDVLLLGDNLVVLPGATLTDPRLSQLDLEPGRRYRKRLAHGTGFDETHRSILRELQTQQAARRNRAGGYWIAEADPAAACHALTRRFRLDDVPWAGLATDGAYKPMRHLGLDDWPRLASCDAAVLQRILRRCENWEARRDPAAIELPRAKRHDDKSIAFARFIN